MTEKEFNDRMNALDKQEMEIRRNRILLISERIETLNDKYKEFLGKKIKITFNKFGKDSEVVGFFGGFRNYKNGISVFSSEIGLIVYKMKKNGEISANQVSYYNLPTNDFDNLKIENYE